MKYRESLIPTETCETSGTKDPSMDLMSVPNTSKM